MIGNLANAKKTYFLALLEIVLTKLGWGIAGPRDRDSDADRPTTYLARQIDDLTGGIPLGLCQG